MLPKKINNIFGFTLVELLVVMAIVSVLVTLGIGGFSTSQMRGRDGARKSDLKQISSALELYYTDYNKYPDILPAWGSEFTDGKTVYFKTLPKDPSASQSYLYRVVDPGPNQKYQLFARIENTQDKDLVVVNHMCGSKACNFAITSSNTNATE